MTTNSFYYENQKSIVSLYRKLNPQSRAVKDWTFGGSTGSVKRGTCIFCRKIISTCSNNWPITKKFIQELESHTPECGTKWLLNQTPHILKNIK